MHAKGFLHKLLFPAIHKTRLTALSDVVTAAICIKKLNLTALGRELDGIKERSGIQKVNRLLGNKHLLKEQKMISKVVADLLIGSKTHPKIIIDWSKYPNSEDAVLRAALSAEGRALTIYDERHPVKKMGNKKIQTGFLATLKSILPKQCRAIIITDAGFHNDWFKSVVKNGWEYIGRVRGLKKCCSAKEDKFISCKKLFKAATREAKYLGEMTLTKKNPMHAHLYLVAEKLKGRKALTKSGKVSKHKDSKAYSRSYREPWLLASSITGRNAAKRIQQYYKQRMTIEEGFRDMKSSRYGLGLEEGRSKVKTRRNILLLIAMLASLIAWITGMAGERMKLQYQYQSNSIKHRRVVSLFFLGCRLIRKRTRIPTSLFWEIIASLKREAICV